MRKEQNEFQHHVLKAAKGMTLFNGEIYTKVYISHEDIDPSAWIEVEDALVPPVEEEEDEPA